MNCPYCETKLGIFKDWFSTIEPSKSFNENIKDVVCSHCESSFAIERLDEDEGFGFAISYQDNFDDED